MTDDNEDTELMIAEMKARQEEEAKLAAEQDAALAAVKAACDAERAALSQIVQE